MIGRLNHVAIAVADIAKAADVYRRTLGAEVSPAVAQPDHGVTTVFITLPNTKIELIEPLGEGSPIAKFLERRRLQPVGGGGTNALERLDEQPDLGPDPQAAWEQEYRKQLFRVAAGRLENSFTPTTWQAFWGTAVEGKGAAAVAEELHLSVGAVYVAKSRVLARLTEEIQQLQAE